MESDSSIQANLFYHLRAFFGQEYGCDETDAELLAHKALSLKPQVPLPADVYRRLVDVLNDLHQEIFMWDRVEQHREHDAVAFEKPISQLLIDLLKEHR